MFLVENAQQFAAELKSNVRSIINRLGQVCQPNSTTTETKQLYSQSYSLTSWGSHSCQGDLHPGYKSTSMGGDSGLTDRVRTVPSLGNYKTKLSGEQNTMV